MKGINLHLCHFLIILLCCYIITRDSIYAIARICYRPSVRPSLRSVDHRKTVEVRIMKFSPYDSPIALVFAG